MFLAGKIGWAGVALTLLMTGMLLQGFPRSAAGADAGKEVAVFVVRSESRKVQETLRNKGHYDGKIDGVFGLVVQGVDLGIDAHTTKHNNSAQPDIPAVGARAFGHLCRAARSPGGRSRAGPRSASAPP